MFYLQKRLFKDMQMDLGQYERPTEYAKKFNIKDWAFFIAYDANKPVGASTVAYNSKEILMLDGRDDLCVLWDLRVDDRYKRMGIGTKLFQMAVEWATSKNIKQMKIECQNTNVPAVKFYYRHGAVLGAFNEYFYYHDVESRNEIALFLYLNLPVD